MAHSPLKSLAEDCLDQHVLLISYIDDAYDEADEKTAHEAAGSLYYAKAANGNWISLRNLNTASLLFIKNNQTVLQKGGENMPATFLEQYTNVVNTFNDQYMLFVKTDQKNPAATAEKIITNNKIYKDLIAMFRDGCAIFRRNDTIKSYFTLDEILHRITGERTTGVRIEAIEDITELPVQGVTITAQPTNTTAITAEDGITKMPLPENKYILTITVPTGYQPVPAQSLKTTTGIMHRKKFILKKLG